MCIWIGELRSVVKLTAIGRIQHISAGGGDEEAARARAILTCEQNAAVEGEKERRPTRAVLHIYARSSGVSSVRED